MAADSDLAALSDEIVARTQNGTPWVQDGVRAQWIIRESRRKLDRDLLVEQLKQLGLGEASIASVLESSEVVVDGTSSPMVKITPLAQNK